MGQVELARGRIAAERAGEDLAMQLCLARNRRGLRVGIGAVLVVEAELLFLRGPELAEPAVRADRSVAVAARFDLEQARGIGTSIDSQLRRAYVSGGFRSLSAVASRKRGA